MSSSPRRVHSKSIEKRQRVLDATAKVLARRGYAETTLTEIAADVGTHAGSIYYYFPSREALVMEVLLASIDRVYDVLHEALEASPDLSPRERLRTAIKAALVLNTSPKGDYSQAYQRSFNQIPDELVSQFSVRRGKTRSLWRQLLRDAQDSGYLPGHVDINIATQLIMGATNWVATWYNPSGPLSREAICDSFVDLLLHGLVGNTS